MAKIEEETAAYCVKLSEDFSTLFYDERFSDITITVQNSIFFAHKVILTARCPLFATMFHNDIRESCITNHLEITDVNDEIFVEILRFIYTGRVIKVDQDLLQAADKYALEDLKTLCGLKLSKDLTVDNAANMLIMADQMNVENLKLSAFKFINEHASQVFQTEGYKSLVTLHLRLIEELYRHQHAA